MSRAIDAEALTHRMCELCNQYYSDDPCEPSDCIFAWAVKEAPTLTPQNEPLTLDELLTMNGEPVWLDVADGVWALVDANDNCVWLDRGGSININKLAGKVYRRPPERQEGT